MVAQTYFDGKILDYIVSNFFVNIDINMFMKKLHFGDIVVTIPFAYIISQSLLMFDVLWFFAALWTFDMYAHMRRKQNV